MNAPRIELSITNGLARITFTEANHNAVDSQWTHEFADAAVACGADSTVKAVLVKARGSSFGVGGDIKEFVRNRNRIKAHVLDMATHFHNGIAQLRNGAAPVIMAVNGMAAGGSFTLVCSADMAVAARSAKFVSAYSRSGLSPDGGGSYFLPRIVGLQKAFDIFATSPTLSADQALELGIITRVFDDNVFEVEVEKLAQTIMDAPPGALAALKKLLRASTTASLEEQMVAEAESIASLAAVPSTMDRLTAFVEKKPK